MKMILFILSTLIVFIVLATLVSADTWEYTLFIYDTKNTTDRVDDVQLSNHTVVVDEGTTGTYFGGSNSGIENLSINHTYFVFIKGNTTEADYNYDADGRLETYWHSQNIGDTGAERWRGCNNPAGVGKLFLIKSSDSNCDVNFVPTDTIDSGTTDTFFWSSLVGDLGSESKADVVNFTQDNLTFEDFGFNLDFGVGYKLDFQNTESATLSTDPEDSTNDNVFDSKNMAVGNWYYWGVIFKVNKDWIEGDTDVELFHHEGEGGDLDQEVLWNWTINITTLNKPASVTLNTPSNNTFSHNKTRLFNFTIDEPDEEEFNYTLWADRNPNPRTMINSSNNTLDFNSTLLFTFPEVEQSINGTYYWKINGSDNHNNFTSGIFTFNITNAVDTATNVSVTDLPATADTQLKGHFNITCGAGDTFCNLTISDTRWYLNGTVLDTAYNNSILNDKNVTPDANITFSARVNDGYGGTAWTEWVNSSTANVGDTTDPFLSNLKLTKLNLTVRCQDADSSIKKINYTINLSDGTKVVRDSDNDFTIDSDLQDIHINVSSIDTETLLNGTYNITQIGCLDGNDNYFSNETVVDLNFSISNPILVSVFLTDNSITTDETTNLTMVCQADPNLRIQTINFTLNRSDGVKQIRDNPTYFTFTQNNTVNVTYELYETDETANEGTDNITQIGCFDTETNYFENISTSNLAITISSRPSGDNGGPSGGGGGQLVPEKVIVEKKIEIAVERCGNFVCEECDESSPEGCIDETPLNCLSDCRLFSLDELFCTPVFNCGNWLKSWFVNSMIILVLVGMVYMQVRAKRLKVKRL